MNGFFFFFFRNAWIGLDPEFGEVAPKRTPREWIASRVHVDRTRYKTTTPISYASDEGKNTHTRMYIYFTGSCYVQIYIFTVCVCVYLVRVRFFCAPSERITWVLRVVLARVVRLTDRSVREKKTPDKTTTKLTSEQKININITRKRLCGISVGGHAENSPRYFVPISRRVSNG